jgi:hypothetical protein
MPLTPGSSTMLGSANPATSGETAAGVLGNASLTDTATVTPRESIEDGAGGTYYQEGGPFTLPCRLSKARQMAESIQGEAVMSRVTYTCQFPVGSDVEPSYKVEVGALSFEVVATDEGVSGATFLTADLVRLS